MVLNSYESVNKPRAVSEQPEKPLILVEVPMKLSYNDGR